MSFLARNFQRGCRICISIGHFLRKCFFLKIFNFFKNFRTLSDIFLLKKNQAWITSPVSTSLGRIVKGAFFESRGSFLERSKNWKTIRSFVFFSDFQRNSLYFLQKVLQRWFPNYFSRVQKKFWWLSAGNIFLIFHFWTLTVGFLHFVQKIFNMSETFSAVWPMFFDMHVRPAFFASNQTLRNLLSNNEKD